MLAVVLVILCSILILILWLILSGGSLCWHFTDVAVPMMRKPDSPTGTEALAPNSTIVVILFASMCFLVKNKIRFLNFLNSQPSSTHLFNILCNKIATEVWLLPWGEATSIIWVWAALATFFKKHHLRWKTDWQANYGHVDLDWG